MFFHWLGKEQRNIISHQLDTDIGKNYVKNIILYCGKSQGKFFILHFISLISKLDVFLKISI